MVEFIYHGSVRGQGRPRFTKNGHAYESAEDKAYKEALRAAYEEQCGVFFADKAVSVRVDVFRSLPEEAPDGINPVDDTCSPGAHEIASEVIDALEGVAYSSTNQVVEVIAAKHRLSKRNECIIVEIDEA